MYGFIYLTKNKLNGKKYIGMCKSTHLDNYLGSGTTLKKAIKKYGKENFTRIVLEECKTFQELSDAEEYWIKKYDAVANDNFYNLTSGGYGGNSDYMKEYWSLFTEEERKLCRNWSKRNKTGENNPMWQKKHSVKTKKLIGSKSINRNWNHPDHKGSNNPKAKKVVVEMNGSKSFYNCLRDFSNSCKLNYSSLKSIAKDGRFSKKYNIKITYV